MEMNKIRKVICAREEPTIDFAGAQDGNMSVSSEAGMGKSIVLAPVLLMV